MKTKIDYKGWKIEWDKDTRNVWLGCNGGLYQGTLSFVEVYGYVKGGNTEKSVPDGVVAAAQMLENEWLDYLDRHENI